MKKILIIALFGGLFTAVSSCNKNNGCPNNSEKATVYNYSNDSCDILFQLEDGTKLEPTNLSEFQSVNYETGQLIWLDYKEASGASLCDIGEIIEIKCVSEREF